MKSGTFGVFLFIFAAFFGQGARAEGQELTELQRSWNSPENAIWLSLRSRNKKNLKLVPITGIEMSRSGLLSYDAFLNTEAVQRELQRLPVEQSHTPLTLDFYRNYLFSKVGDIIFATMIDYEAHENRSRLQYPLQIEPERIEYLRRLFYEKLDDHIERELEVHQLVNEKEEGYIDDLNMIRNVYAPGFRRFSKQVELYQNYTKGKSPKAKSKSLFLESDWSEPLQDDDRWSPFYNRIAQLQKTSHRGKVTIEIKTAPRSEEDFEKMIKEDIQKDYLLGIRKAYLGSILGHHGVLSPVERRGLLEMTPFEQGEFYSEHHKDLFQYNEARVKEILVRPMTGDNESLKRALVVRYLLSQTHFYERKMEEEVDYFIDGLPVGNEEQMGKLIRNYVVFRRKTFINLIWRKTVRYIKNAKNGIDSRDTVWKDAQFIRRMLDLGYSDKDLRALRMSDRDLSGLVLSEYTLKEQERPVVGNRLIDQVNQIRYEFAFRGQNLDLPMPVVTLEKKEASRSYFFYLEKVEVDTGVFMPFNTDAQKRIQLIKSQRALRTLQNKLVEHLFDRHFIRISPYFIDRYSDLIPDAETWRAGILDHWLQPWVQTEAYRFSTFRNLPTVVLHDKSIY